MCNLQMCNKNVLKWDDILYYLVLNINGDAFELNLLALDFRLRCTQCAFFSLIRDLQEFQWVFHNFVKVNFCNIWYQFLYNLYLLYMGE